ncbi:transcription elongation GreA/GreB family factor [Maribacter spongiicola]|uniref:Transcription elongation GreA/GreB family factor n=1 Tax=Maribacter spongiicola TaxID=1206753 RepID=A0A4R7K4R6_9FLAO|nr:3-oxoacyl-ACP synthase [Maribacter spongiicola]TDT46195.1 transcription elongation GreA/GreB family factor [Maribacter spongiicola]
MKETESLEILKKDAYDFCVHFVNDRLTRIQNQIKELESALTSETKSSAGDKHETGRAMIQLEREKLGQQLAELEKTQQLLLKVPKDRNASTVGLGSLVVTDSFVYYIAISAGEFKSKPKSVYCISAATPIGKLVFGKKVGDVFSFNGKELIIDSIG